MREMPISYRLIRSGRRRTISIELSLAKGVVVRAPMRTPLSEIERFVADKSRWIERSMARLEAEQLKREQEAKDAPPQLTDAEIRELADRAMSVIPERVEYYARLINVSYGKITIRNQRSRWGSCSSKGNLNFNCLLMLVPQEVIDSVIVHELCHRKHMNHSKAFYSEVYRVSPDYDRWDKWLKEHGEEIMRRMTG